MQLNLLKLNQDKTELCIISAKSADNVFYVEIGGHLILPDMTGTEPPRNLGVYIDPSLNFDAHVRKTCKAMNFQLRSINKIRSLLTRTITEKLVNALVTSRMDNCNSLLFGTHKYVIQRLQRVQNYAARTVTQQPKRAHATPILRELHWLPVAQRINFKIIMLTWKALNGQAPAYLKDIIPAQSSGRATRSSDKSLLLVPRVKPSFGERAFSYSSPRLWNPLPIELKNQSTIDAFKSRLKTFLFDNPTYPPPLLK